MKDDGIHEAFIYIVGSDVNPDQEMKDRYSDYPAPISIQVIQSKEEIRIRMNRRVRRETKKHEKDMNNY